MAERPHRCALSWSGGKDSAMALHVMQRDFDETPLVLLTILAEEHDRVSIHGVRSDLVRRQAAATGIELAAMSIPPDCSRADYDARFLAALRSDLPPGVAAVAFGDLFLEDVRAGRERLLSSASMRARFPLWGRDTRVLAREFLDDGFNATVVCVDTAVLDPSFVGRPYDRALLADLPTEVDPCGENGEFHTFVTDGPVFAEPVDCVCGPRVARGGFAFADLQARCAESADVTTP